VKNDTAVNMDTFRKPISLQVTQQTHLSLNCARKLQPRRVLTHAEVGPHRFAAEHNNSFDVIGLALEGLGSSSFVSCRQIDAGRPMQEIADWLKKLGLGQYAQRFAENDITFAILPDLTDQDFMELGVASLGHRRQLLRAIAEQNRLEQGTPGTAIVPRDIAERRQVSVMFSDLVGSTALSARMDPEDLREVISAYQKCVAETVRRFDGFVARYMGDGVLVYFGYPQAHEDDAERAVRAGLELIAAVGALKLAVQLQTRVGISTGLVVVGDLVGSGEAQERGIVGETPNLAARTQAAAAPDSLIASEATWRLAGPAFEYEDLGPRELKGIPGTLRLWYVIGEGAARGRFDARLIRGLAPLVGRSEEIALLRNRWAYASDGDGQLVLLSAPAGVGKSRPMQAFRDSLDEVRPTCLQLFGSPVPHQQRILSFHPLPRMDVGNQPNRSAAAQARKTRSCSAPGPGQRFRRRAAHGRTAVDSAPGALSGIANQSAGTEAKTGESPGAVRCPRQAKHEDEKAWSHTSSLKLSGTAYRGRDSMGQ
jgi:class 3 adenylate cyclase